MRIMAHQHIDAAQHRESDEHIFAMMELVMIHFYERQVTILTKLSMHDISSLGCLNGDEQFVARRVRRDHPNQKRWSISGSIGRGQCSARDTDQRIHNALPRR